MILLEPDEEIDNLEEEDRKIPALNSSLRNTKGEVLRTTAKVDQLKIYSITKANELLYARAAVVRNRLRVKMNKTEERVPIWRRVKELRKYLGQLQSLNNS